MENHTEVFAKNNTVSKVLTSSEELFDILRQIPTATASHGEASFGYSFKLADGGHLIIGHTDDDVSDPHICWFTYYKNSGT